MYPNPTLKPSCLLKTPEILWILFRIDQDLAEGVRKEGCPFCGSPLHAAHFHRKPRGFSSAQIGDQLTIRFDWCCSRCRRRCLPPSIRFFSRRLYWAPLFLILSALRRSRCNEMTRRCLEQFEISRRTLQRWRRWWRYIFPNAPFWKRAQLRFNVPVDDFQLPQSLLDRFVPDGKSHPLILALKFLLVPPLRTG
jgi:hypothetical protein